MKNDNVNTLVSAIALEREEVVVAVIRGGGEQMMFKQYDIPLI